MKIFYLEDSGCPSSLHFSKWHNRPQGLEAPDDAQCCRLQIWWKYVLKEVHFVICDLDNFFVNEGETDDVASSINDNVDVIFKRSVFELNTCFRLPLYIGLHDEGASCDTQRYVIVNHALLGVNPVLGLQTICFVVKPFVEKSCGFAVNN